MVIFLIISQTVKVKETAFLTKDQDRNLCNQIGQILHQNEPAMVEEDEAPQEDRVGKDMTLISNTPRISKRSIECKGKMINISA